jgi:DnaJ-class molecular chaperone
MKDSAGRSPSIGLECDECNGVGWAESEHEDEREHGTDCPKCEGWGVVEIDAIAQGKDH